MTPTAEVEFSSEGNEQRFEVEVENVNLPAGTRLNVLVDNARAGTIVLDNQFEGELRLRTDDGQTVPQVTSRSQIVIATQTGTTIVAGTFSPSPLPSPTPNPSPGPNPSPSPSPSPNPSPNPSGETRIQARLAGVAINGLIPRGVAESRTREDGRRKFKVEVEKVNLPAGTLLNVLVDSLKVGELTIASILEAELELESENGQFVPRVMPNSTVVVATQSGTTVVAGSFNTSLVPTQGNDIDHTPFFVEQQYRDFFDREPDDSGLSFWTSQITRCGGDAGCVEHQRANTSGAFFLSIEFQNTGYLLYRFHKASFNRIPRRVGFLIDLQAIGQGVVVNAPGWETKLEANIRAVADAWVSRAEFRQIYDGKTNTQYVDMLYANAGVTPSPEVRSALITGLNSGTETRATVLRKVADDRQFYEREFNPAFVLMQYFGYLHRNPDEGPDNNFDGYNFWLNKLNEFNGDFHRADMVESFIRASEYRNRFDN